MLTATTLPPRPAETASDQRLLREVSQVFDLGHLERIAVITEGLLNRNWKISAGGVGYAVKQVLDVSAEQARRQYKAMAALADRGLPVPPPLRTSDGETLWQGPQGNFCVLPWVCGTHVAGRDWTLDQADHVGDLLGRLHLALAEVMPPVPAAAAAVTVPEPATAKSAVDRYMGLIDARPVRDPFDVLVERRLRQRRELLERVLHLRPDQTTPVAPHGWAHGDFHDLNLVWGNGTIAAVLDWDRMNTRPLAGEVVRSATLLFATGDERGLNLDQVAVFAAAYRRIRPLTAGQLADAAHRLWWERVCDFWQLKRHYDQHDTSCDHLFTSASALLEWWSEHRDEITAAFAS